MKRGSITPFCTLSLILIASLLFALLESARFYGLDCYATLKADTAIDSVCAEYQPYLWEQYGLLFLDGAYGAEQFSMGYVMEQMEDHMVANCKSGEWLENWLGLDLFRLTQGDVLLEGYALATDDAGTLFLNYVAAREKEKLPIGVAEDLYKQYQETRTVEKEHSGVEESIVKAQEVFAEAKSEWRVRQEESEIEAEPVSETLDTSEVEGIFDVALQIQSSGTLNLIFEDLSEISDKNCKLRSDLGIRKKEEGTMYLKADKEWYQKILVLTYLEEVFSNVINPKSQHFLEYEMEYVLCGKDAEWENLDGALDRMLLLREAANVVCLLQDEEKMSQAEELASLVGLLVGGNAGVVKVVQIGIIGAWAYMESILDVRALVAGGVIPLIKQKSEWTTNMTNFLSVMDKNVKAKECVNGLNYTDYMKQLIFFMETSKLAYRMMEVMELGMRSQPLYENCQMDHMVVMMRFKVAFESEPIFSSLVSIGDVYQGKYIFTKEIERSYVP